jgi:hypothetical protein
MVMSQARCCCKHRGWCKSRNFPTTTTTELVLRSCCFFSQAALLTCFCTTALQNFKTRACQHAHGLASCGKLSVQHQTCRKSRSANPVRCPLPFCPKRNFGKYPSPPQQICLLFAAKVGSGRRGLKPLGLLRCLEAGVHIFGQADQSSCC